ncbi:E3 ubiquitin-protein ligase MARCHF6-like [Antennarius striatus]|uniref:E3 ubiquitin-protein ligase MARCHF6-like n=1 Tax=Antennarius striatus TaxID=241820 RepID=UPI0035B2BEFA
MDTVPEVDICRVCRAEGSLDKPLYYPCVCTGSIKFIHQECLLQWLEHSRKEYCELCQHKFEFTPVYSPDMPTRLPVWDIFTGLLISIGTAIRYWLHYALVALAWLGFVPLLACRIYHCLFCGSVSALVTLPFDMISTENLLPNFLQGCVVVGCTLGTFVGLIWLREQIFDGGAPQWLVENQPNGPPANEDPAGGARAQQHAGPVPYRLAHAHPHGAYNQGDEDEDEEEDVYEDEEEESDEEVDANNGGQGGLNWNMQEVEREGEELTWERMLGLDGSIAFLEHVFWLVSLNALFVLVFAFCPYHIGRFCAVGLGFEDYVKASHFEGVVTTILGYILLAGVLMFCHILASLLNFQRPRLILGVFYLAIKVPLLVLMELGFFPLTCGWWLDICSLEMFDVTLKDRMQSLESAPVTTMFLHWLVGVVYIYYFASSILLLKEVLRPGVLWFMRNISDPDFDPIHDMIHRSLFRHLRRFTFSVVVFGSVVLLMVWLPIGVIKTVYPMFFPYNVMLYSDTPVSERSLELFLLQVVFPALMEQGQTRQWLKQVVHAWTFTVAYVLDLHSYLLGGFEEDDPVDHHDDNGIPDEGEELDAAQQPFLRQGRPVEFPPYHRPLYFPLKIILLLLFLCVTLFITSLLCLTIPVSAGRWLMSFWLGSTVVHELYTAASGLFFCWLSVRAFSVLLSWVPQGWAAIVLKVHEWTLMILKTAVVSVMLVGVIPLLLGLLFELVIVVPYRVPLDQTPLFYLWQIWALGVLHAKIISAFTVLGPQWWLKTAIEQVYADGIRNIDLRFIWGSLAAPVISILLLCLCVPHAISTGIVLLLGVQPELQILVERRIYPFLLLLTILLAFLFFQIRHFKHFYQHIREDRYLVGQRLVNFESMPGSSGSSSSS